MATLDTDELTRIRRGMAKLWDTMDGGINYSKTEINPGPQAVEDWWEKAATKASLSADIDAATSPFVLTNAQKKKMVKFWLKEKSRRE